MTESGTPLLERLRSETRDAHEALHHHPLLAPLVSPDLTLRDYHYALLAFDAFYGRLDTAIGESAPVRDWLAHDLTHQGLKPLPLPGVALPVIATESQTWGYLYVKQGSTLGGTVISRNLKRVLGLNPFTDQQFFAGFGEETGIRWKKFIENLFSKAAFLDAAETAETAVACFRGVADICDAVLVLKDSHAVQAASATDRSAT